MRIGLRALLCLSIITVAFGSPSAHDREYTLEARYGTPRVDGDLNDPEWKGADWRLINVYQASPNPEGGPSAAGFGAKLALLWDKELLYAGAIVTDDAHVVPTVEPPMLYTGDSVQFAIDLQHDGRDRDMTDVEWGYALRLDRVAFPWEGAFRLDPVIKWVWSGGRYLEFIKESILRDDRSGKTYYETAVKLTVPGKAQTLSQYVERHPQSVAGFSCLVNQNNGGGRVGWLEWSSGIGRDKRAYLFGDLSFEVRQGR